MKFKPLSEYQILITLDRLTRFKPVFEKYPRVFKDIIVSNLLEPKFKKNELDEMSAAEITSLAEFVFNATLQSMGFQAQKEFPLNKKLAEYEKSVFYLSEEEKTLLNNRLALDSAIKLLNDDVPQNLRWLQFLAKDTDFKAQNFRERYALKYPLSAIIITEGVTEEILLPRLAQLCGFDFDRNGIQVLSAGGKNQSVKLFYSTYAYLKLPIFVLFDLDAKDNLDQIMPKLRQNDNFHLISCGEFEDILPKDLLIRSINTELQNFSLVEPAEFVSELSTVKNLEEIFKKKGLHEFKKAEFAQLVKENLNEETILTPEIRLIIEKIRVASQNVKNVTAPV